MIALPDRPDPEQENRRQCLARANLDLACECARVIAIALAGLCLLAFATYRVSAWWTATPIGGDAWVVQTDGGIAMGSPEGWVWLDDDGAKVAPVWLWQDLAVLWVAEPSHTGDDEAVVRWDRG